MLVGDRIDQSGRGVGNRQRLLKIRLIIWMARLGIQSEHGVSSVDWLEKSEDDIEQSL